MIYEARLYNDGDEVGPFKDVEPEPEDYQAAQDFFDECRRLIYIMQARLTLTAKLGNNMASVQIASRARGRYFFIEA